MPNELPAFLSDFLAMRKQVSGGDKNKLPSAEKAKLRGEGITKKEAIDMSIQHIIEKKPGRKVLEEFLQKRCDDLTVQKMAKS